MSNHSTIFKSVSAKQVFSKHRFIQTLSNIVFLHLSIKLDTSTNSF